MILNFILFKNICSLSKMFSNETKNLFTKTHIWDNEPACKMNCDFWLDMF